MIRMIKYSGHPVRGGRLHLLLLALLLASTTAVSAQEVRQVRATLDAQIQANAAQHAIPGQAVLVLHNGKTLYRATTGTPRLGGGQPLTDQAVFPLFSISKLYANVLVLQLVEQGKLNLAAPASRYVPSLPPPLGAIQVGQFLSHCSGVAEYFTPSDLTGSFPPTLSAALARAAAQPLLFAPGTQSRYTQTNYLVVEAILEQVTGLSYRTLLQERVLRPLHLRETWLQAAEVPAKRLVSSYTAEAGRVVPQAPIAWPDYALVHGGICATGGDLAAFLAAVAAGRLVSQAALLRLWKPYPLANGQTGDFAAGWDYYQAGNWQGVGHDGGTKVRVRLLFQQDLADTYVVAYLTNGNKDDVWSRTLLDSVQHIVLPPQGVGK